MAEIFISMIVMDILDNSIKNYQFHKDPQNIMIMINGLQKSMINGYLKKMH